MEEQLNLQKLAAQIESLKQSADALERLGGAFPAVAKNAARIQASIKMLELNVSDLVNLDKSGRLSAL
jgi:hypothetical protein